MVWESHVHIFCLFNKYTVNGRVNKYVTFFFPSKKNLNLVQSLLSKKKKKINDALIAAVM